MLPETVLLDMIDVSLKYDSMRNLILKNVNLKVILNQWIAIVGDNGSGKTTLLKSMLGIVPLHTGSKYLNEAYLNKNNDFIGYIPQEKPDIVSDYISCRSILLNSIDPTNKHCLTEQDKIKRLNEISQQIEIDHFLDHSLSELSGGQKKRIFLAQSLLNNPNLLIMDEPLANLDTGSKKAFIKILRTLSTVRPISVIIVSHDLHNIDVYFDTFIHIKNHTIHTCKNKKCIRDSHVFI